MTTTLGTLELPDGLLWTDESDTQAVSTRTRRRLDGGLTVFARRLSAGRPVTLKATSDDPLTRTQWATLEAMRASVATPYALSWPDRSFNANVMILALDLEDEIPYADPQGSDPVIGTISLMTV